MFRFILILLICLSQFCLPNKANASVSATIIPLAFLKDVNTVVFSIDLAFKTDDVNLELNEKELLEAFNIGLNQNFSRFPSIIVIYDRNLPRDERVGNNILSLHFDITLIDDSELNLGALTATLARSEPIKTFFSKTPITTHHQKNVSIPFVVSNEKSTLIKNISNAVVRLTGHLPTYIYCANTTEVKKCTDYPEPFIIRK